MKILILVNLWHKDWRFIPTFLSKFINFYTKVKIFSLIKNLDKNLNNKIPKYTILSEKKIFKNYVRTKNINFSDIRTGLDHQEYLKIKNKVVENTKETIQNLSQIFCNLSYKKKQFEIIKIIEFKLKNYLNTISGNLELLKLCYHNQKFDKIIIFNNKISDFYIIKNFLDIDDLELYKDFFLEKYEKLIPYLNLAFYLLKTFGSFIKNEFRNRRIKNENRYLNSDIIFFAESFNQKASIKPILKHFQTSNQINTILLNYDYSTSIIQISNVFQFISYIIAGFQQYKTRIFKNFIYDKLDLKPIIVDYFNKFCLILLVKIYKVQEYLDQIWRTYKPKMVIITNDFLPIGRLTAIFFNSKNCLTCFIPHAAMPIIKEISILDEIDYFMVGGIKSKNYLNDRNIADKRIFISGIPRYESFYQNKIGQLDRINGMFNKKELTIGKKKPLILLTTNPIDDKSNRDIIYSTVCALKELSLTQNLVIKLHPREDGKMHKKVLEELNNKPIIIRDYDILEVINSCDLLISQKSTTILEAMILSKPVILIDYINKDFTETSLYQFLDKQKLIAVNDPDSLIIQIKNLLEDPKLRIKYGNDLKKFSNKFSIYDPENPPTKKIGKFLKSQIRKA